MATNYCFYSKGFIPLKIWNGGEERNLEVKFLLSLGRGQCGNQGVGTLGNIELQGSRRNTEER